MPDLIALGLFTLGIAIGWEFVGAKRSLAEKNLRPWPAVFWSILCAGLGWVDYLLADRVATWIIVPNLIGVGIGEYFAVKQNKVQE